MSWRLAIVAAAVAWYAGVGCWTAGVYAIDKRRAATGGRRVPERRLRKLEILGGAFGAAIAQPMLRHKTRKPGFRGLTLLIAAVHAAAIAGAGWLITSH
ncbi:MAG: DUF1294 domain-containing protein [Planctomycetota bacterium]